MNDKFQNLINSEKPVLLDFYADWCGPCQAMKPILVQLKEKVGEDAIIVKINTEKNQDLSAFLQIRSIPTLMLYKKGEMLWRHSGVVDANELYGFCSMLYHVKSFATPSDNNPTPLPLTADILNNPYFSKLIP
jgi:thioredoxin 1